MIARAAIIAATLMAGHASAATVQHHPPIPVPHGLTLTVDPIEGRHSFNPADGVDAYLHGKAGPRMDVTTERRPMTPQRLTRVTQRRPEFPLPPGLIDNPACERAQSRPWFCEADTVQPREPIAPVPLPAAGWMLLAGLAGLGVIRRMKR